MFRAWRALLDGHGGVLDQAGFQAGEVLLFGTGRLVVLDELADLLLDGPDEGVRTRTVAKRKRVFRKAMLTAFMVALTKPKCTTLFTP